MAKGMIDSIEIEATAEEVYAVAADVSAYPEWAQGVKSVEVLSLTDEGDPERATFTIEAFVKEIVYTLTYDNDRPLKMAWEADPSGDVKELTGSYAFDESAGKTVVTYALRFNPTVRIPGFMLRQGERQIIQTALRGLKKRVEGSRG